MDAQKIIDEIGVFLDRSLLKKSKITKAGIVREFLLIYPWHFEFS